MNKKINIVSVIGNIGSGKSTIAELLGKKMKLPYLLEEPANYLFLEEAFSNPKKYSLSNQLDFISVKYLEVIKNIATNHTLIQEMDLLSTHKIWTPVLKKLDYIGVKEEKLLNNYFEITSDSLEFKYTIKPIYIFVNCSKENVINRINSRGRDFEKSSIEELKKIVSLIDEQILSFMNSVSNFVAFNNNSPSFEESVACNVDFFPSLIKHL